MPWGYVAGAAVGAYGANQQAGAAQDAANQQAGATALSLAEQKRQFDMQQNQMAPWLRSGRLALNEQNALMGLGGDTEAANRALISSPNYRFALEQGNRALSGGLAARGGMGSGKAMTAATEYGQNFATGQRANRLSELANMSGVGQGAATSMGNAGMNYANNLSNLWTNNANAQGAAGIAGANARQSGIVGGLGLGMNMYDYMNRQPRNNSNGNGYWSGNRPPASDPYASYYNPNSYN